MKKKILIVLACLVAVAGVLCGIFYPDSKINNTLDVVQDTIMDEIQEIDNPSTTEIPELTENDEQILEVQETEAEGFKEQGEVAYNGSDKAPNVSVGEYAGLTYYSQVDSRWKNKMYSVINDSSQTIGSSGCGPTSAAMVVSSIKGIITPDTMADLYVRYGYRSTNNGTYWSAFKWTADVFDIDFYQCYSLDTVIERLKDNNYVIASCNEGLFTYGGHFIVIVGVEGDTLKIYDPYLYNGKFTTSTRKGKATVSGNTVYVTVDNFKKYANAKGYFCFKNNRTDIKDNNTNPTVDNTPSSNVTNVNYRVKVTAKIGLNIRSGASTSYNIVGGYPLNTIVTITAESNGWGKTDKGWICLTYTQRLDNGNTQTSSSNRKIGDIVTINGVYTSSVSTKKLLPAVTKGTITKILNNARNPYLLNNGNIGWINDSCIVSSSGTTNYSNISKGDKVKVKNGAKTYTGGNLASFVYTKTYDVIESTGNRVVIGIGNKVTAAIHKDNLIKQ